MTWRYEETKYIPTWQDDFFKVVNLYPKGRKQENYNMKIPPGTEAFWKQEEEKDIFELYIPGYSKYDVSITVKEKTNKNKNIEIIYCKEKRQENIYSFDIYDKYEIPTEATVKDGVLTIEFYKTKEVKLNEYKLKIN